MLVCDWEVLSLLHGGDDNYSGGCDDAVTVPVNVPSPLHTQILLNSHNQHCAVIVQYTIPISDILYSFLFLVLFFSVLERITSELNKIYGVIPPSTPTREIQ